MKRNAGSITAAALSGAALMASATTPALADPPIPFKQTNIHFETNGSACDMGIQMSFDTDGVTEARVESPDGRVVFDSLAVFGAELTSDLTEMFHERVEPPIADLLAALDCEPAEDDAISLNDLLSAWPAGWYEFEGRSAGTEFEGRARLTHRIPAGPEITSPEDGVIVSADEHLLITWEPVTGPIVHYLGPVQVVAYHVVVADVTDPELAPGATKTVLDADLSAEESSFLVPRQFLEPGRIYEFEVLSTERLGNETITEGGVFCTPPIGPDECEAP